MIRHRRNDRSASGLTCQTHARTALLACALLWSAAVQAQQAPQGGAEAHDQSPTEQVPDAGYRPGFLDALGRWLGSSKQAIDTQLKDTKDRLGTLGSQATGAAKDVAGAAQAAGTVVGLPIARIVSGRQICVVAPNGGPDCQPAADTLCRTKGFESGKGLDVITSQRCPARAWISGRTSDGECRLETYVTRAACQ